jgi:hypothetical protein
MELLLWAMRASLERKKKRKKGCFTWETKRRQTG